MEVVVCEVLKRGPEQLIHAAGFSRLECHTHPACSVLENLESSMSSVTTR